MSIFRIFVDGQLFYHPQLSQLAITEAKMAEDAENIDSLTLSAPFNHPYLDSIRPMASTIVCKKGDATVFEGRALNDGSDFYNTHTWTCESALAYLKDSQQPPFSYKGTLKGLLEYFLSVHNKAVEEKKRFKLGNITVTDNNDYISYSNSEYSCTLDAIKSKLINTHGGYLMVRYTESEKILDYLAEFNTRSVQSVEYGKNLTDVKITLVNGRGSIVHSVGGDFREATSRAVRQGLMELKQAGNCELLEPWYQFRLTVSQEHVGRAINDIQQMAGTFKLNENNSNSSTTVITGTAPVTEMRKYASVVRAYTHGQGQLELTVSGYQKCHNADEVITKANYNPTADLANTPDSVFCAHGAGYPVKWDQVPAMAHVKDN